MNSYALAFGILGGGVLLALILWSVPKLRLRRQVLQFRKALSHVDVVTIAWAQRLRNPQPFEDLPRRHRNPEPDDGGASLV